MQRRPPTAPPIEPRQVVFDPTAEIFATDSAGSFVFPLTQAGSSPVSLAGFDEARFLVSVWHPSAQRNIDLDRAYVELRTRVDEREDHWIKLAEIEPVVPAYNGGEAFDGWIVLPVLADAAAFSLFGSGFDPRARAQIRASVYLVG